eukprot:3448508-Rhodomonas_salina.1
MQLLCRHNHINHIMVVSVDCKFDAALAVEMQGNDWLLFSKGLVQVHSTNIKQCLSSSSSS